MAWSGRDRRHRSARIWSLLLAATALGVGHPGSAGAVSRAPGTQVWASFYDGPAANDTAYDLVVSPDGARVYVTGISSAGSPDGTEYATVAYLAGTGERLWASRLSEPHGEALAIAVSPDGTRVFVTGLVDLSKHSHGNIGTVAYDAASGAQLWFSKYDQASGDDVAKDVGVSPDGSTVYVTGWSIDADDHIRWSTVAYDAASGVQLWAATPYPSTGGGYSLALSVSPDGEHVYVTGDATGADSTFDYATIAYDAATGTPDWTATYNGTRSGNDTANALALSPDGTRLYVTGVSPGISPISDMTTIGYDALTGTELWVRRYQGPQRTDSDFGVSIQIGSNGTRIYVLGKRFHLAVSPPTIVTVAYDAGTARRLWAVEYDGSFGGATAVALAVRPDGTQVYDLVQESNTDFSVDDVTLALDAGTGAELWTARFNTAAGTYEYPHAIGVRPDGSQVFVTGSGQSSGVTDADYATVAFQT
jgi:hypothetical protein